MSSPQTQSIQVCFQDCGLGALAVKFEEEKVDNLETCQSLTDDELKALGLHTIGDRVLFRARERESLQNQTQSNASANSITTSNPGKYAFVLQNKFH